MWRAIRPVAIHPTPTGCGFPNIAIATLASEFDLIPASSRRLFQLRRMRGNFIVKLDRIIHARIVSNARALLIHAGHGMKGAYEHASREKWL
jgi:hypothetical protein